MCPFCSPLNPSRLQVGAWSQRPLQLFVTSFCYLHLLWVQLAACHLGPLHALLLAPASSVGGCEFEPGALPGGPQGAPAAYLGPLHGLGALCWPCLVSKWLVSSSLFGWGLWDAVQTLACAYINRQVKQSCVMFLLPSPPGQHRP